MKKSEFIAATKGKYNTVVEVGGYIISITGWKPFGWQVVSDTDFQITSASDYPAMASFRTREDLWKFIQASNA